MNTKRAAVPPQILEKFTNVTEIIEAFCKDKLNDEYCHLAFELAAKICRKRLSPMISGSAKSWAAGIIHALGTLNYLFDKSQSPYISVHELCQWFELGQSTINGKSKSIRDMFKMRPMDPKWCLPSLIKDNPMVWLISFDGIIIDVREAPYEIQVAAYEAGVIPYIPDDNTELDSKTETAHLRK